MKKNMSSPTVPKTLRRTAHGLVRCAAIGLAAAMMTPPAHALQHLWDIQEVYTDSSGTLQYIEFFTVFGSQQFVGGHSVSIVNAGGTMTHGYFIPSNLPGDSAGHTFLLGTSGLQAAGGPAPDYIIPDGFLFSDGGTINFFGANSGPYTALPTDGNLSRTWGGGNAVNSPINFAGQSGLVVVPEPTALTLLGLGGIVLGLRLHGRPQRRKTKTVF